MGPAPMENEGAADPKDPTPTKPWVGIEDTPKERLLPAVPTPAVRVLRPNVGVEMLPYTGLLSDVLATLKANGVPWLGIPRPF